MRRCSLLSVFLSYQSRAARGKGGSGTVHGVAAATIPFEPGGGAPVCWGGCIWHESPRLTQPSPSTWLSSGNLRPTRQRLALAALLVGDGLGRHETAEGLYAAAVAAGERVSLATVYNTLRAFCAAGLVNEIVVDGAGSYFDTRLDDHPHFYWEDSHALTDAPAEDLCIATLPSAPAGMQVARVDVIIRLRAARG